MPNHVKNRLIINASDEVLEQIKNRFGTLHESYQRTDIDGRLIYKHNTNNYIGYLDQQTGKFQTTTMIYNDITEKMVMIKEEYDSIQNGYVPDMSEEWYQFPDFTKVITPPDDPAYRDEPSQDAVKNSPNWWYKWNCSFWGTKWNSYSCEQESDNTFTWETAWNNVHKIIETISNEFPNVKFEYEYADEDTGYNVGRLCYLNGELIEEYLPLGGSIEAYDIAFELRPHYKEYYQLIDGKYINIGELDDDEDEDEELSEVYINQGN